MSDIFKIKFLFKFNCMNQNQIATKRQTKLFVQTGLQLTLIILVQSQNELFVRIIRNFKNSFTYLDFNFKYCFNIKTLIQISFYRLKMFILAKLQLAVSNIMNIYQEKVLIVLNYLTITATYIKRTNLLIDSASLQVSVFLNQLLLKKLILGLLIIWQNPLKHICLTFVTQQYLSILLTDIRNLKSKNVKFTLIQNNV
ncbi:hypothetical protein TTHERM_000224588 (macronuclear) [Tetrahymena thermophila SB210]|uniref:Uncharacterized protein n=1 Tax=Tetrahymena thermophila (strain SB210) TaxID=312017 RepID=W7X5S8_TETTS|nr:hypothetical protein TTHERM_000224588 [Tetrahymena thermophila SB210]EWS74715.1 hypothetical protein TTHERM_000224588 [Tetrahymena thermophila SB210]|eukprot:XP_012652716.1 hypothetical protein TTHERM_000224588 [Tetrahymena thermophila SB210]